MATTIPDLWSDDIKVEVLPPIAILKAQEGLLARRTQGLLQAKLTTTETKDLVQHQLDLIAPSLNFYRERLLTATHASDRPYPVSVTAEAFAPQLPDPMRELGVLIAQVANLSKRAATDDEFIRIVQQVLQSETVRALIHSLIARINAGNGEQKSSGGDDEKPLS